MIPSLMVLKVRIPMIFLQFSLPKRVELILLNQDDKANTLELMDLEYVPKKLFPKLSNRSGRGEVLSPINSLYRSLPSLPIDGEGGKKWRVSPYSKDSLSHPAGKKSLPLD
jgi:hypothetical protein